MPTIFFQKENKKISVNAGSNLRKVALQNGIPLYRSTAKIFNCHGFGMCGECAVEITKGENVSPFLNGESKTLQRKKKLIEGVRLACQCCVHGDITVKTL